MSASEKLKALEQAMWVGEWQNKRLSFHEALAEYENAKVALSVALPQIVAVVEAAERVPELRYSNAQPSLTASWSAKNLRRALAALEEALT